MEQIQENIDGIVPAIVDNSSNGIIHTPVNEQTVGQPSAQLTSSLITAQSLLAANSGLLQNSNLLASLNPLGAYHQAQGQQLQRLQQQHLVEQFQSIQSQNLYQQLLQNLAEPNQLPLAPQEQIKTSSNSLSNNNYCLAMDQGANLAVEELRNQYELQAQVLQQSLLMNPIFLQQLIQSMNQQYLLSTLQSHPLAAALQFQQFYGGMPDFNNIAQSFQDSKDYNDKIKRRHIKKQHNPSYNIGHWTTQEHNMYIVFLHSNKDVMDSSELKKTNKIFKQMSDIIKSRSPSQCRSHHQKFNPFSKYLANNVVRRRMKNESDEQGPSNQSPNIEQEQLPQKQEEEYNNEKGSVSNAQVEDQVKAENAAKVDQGFTNESQINQPNESLCQIRNIQEKV